jgi:uncharacterized protein YjbI with pentapeptide repeats
MDKKFAQDVGLFTSNVLDFVGASHEVREFSYQILCLSLHSSNADDAEFGQLMLELRDVMEADAQNNGFDAEKRRMWPTISELKEARLKEARLKEAQLKKCQLRDVQLKKDQKKRRVSIGEVSKRKGRKVYSI